MKVSSDKNNVDLATVTVSSSEFFFKENVDGLSRSISQPDH